MPPLRPVLPRLPLPGIHLPALDGLRGIAVLIVVVLHFSMMTPRTSLERVYMQLAGVGWAGVDLFFVLSGFLITGILLATRRGANYFRNFYIRRTLRIFPLYYAYLALIFLALPLVRSQPPEANHWWVWSYLSNVLMAWEGWEGMPSHTTHLWSLALEEQFYLVWPLIVYWADERGLIRVCLAAIALAVLSRVGLHLYTESGVAGYTLLPARLDSLALGSLLAVAMRDPERARATLRAAAPAALLAVVTLLGLGAWSATRPGSDSYLPPLSFPVQLLGYPAVALLSGAALVFAVTADVRSLLHRFLVCPPLRSLGKYSYAIYLLHIPLRNVARGHFGGALPTVAGSQLPAQLALVAAGVAASYALAMVSWNLFERHFLSLKDRWAPSTLAPSAAGAAAAAPVRAVAGETGIAPGGAAGAY